jgi:hypothetical protein
MMQPAVHIRTRVLPGRKIEVLAPDFTEGEDVEVILTRPAGATLNSALQIIEFLNGHRMHSDATEVSTRLREERDSEVRRS